MTTSNNKVMEFFFEIHQALPRQGPGSSESTRQAFNLLPELSSKPRILDIGCGPGAQTIELAKLSRGLIIALDNHQPYLDQLTTTIQTEALS